MAKETQTRTIDGYDFEVFPLDPKAALKVLTRLTKVVGEPLGLAAAALLGDKDEAADAPDGDPGSALADRNVADAIGPAIAALTDRLDEAVVWDTVETVLRSVYMKAPGDSGTRKINLNVDFQSQTLLMLKAVAFALEVNFSDFFSASGVQGLIARATATAGRLK